MKQKIKELKGNIKDYIHYLDEHTGLVEIAKIIFYSVMAVIGIFVIAIILDFLIANLPIIGIIICNIVSWAFFILLAIAVIGFIIIAIIELVTATKEYFKEKE